MFLGLQTFHLELPETALTRVLEVKLAPSIRAYGKSGILINKQQLKWSKLQVSEASKLLVDIKFCNY